jgi:hypothetical protein
MILKWSILVIQQSRKTVWINGSLWGFDTLAAVYLHFFESQLLNSER